MQISSFLGRMCLQLNSTPHPEQIWTFHFWHNWDTYLDLFPYAITSTRETHRHILGFIPLPSAHPTRETHRLYLDVFFSPNGAGSQAPYPRMPSVLPRSRVWAWAEHLSPGQEYRWDFYLLQPLPVSRQERGQSCRSVCLSFRLKRMLSLIARAEDCDPCICVQF